MAKARTTKPYHHGELREALVVAGRKLLEERGVRGFTLRECARRADVSHAAPAHHFASIDDLLAEIATRGYQELAAAMTAESRRSADKPAARLVGQGIGYMAFAAANPVLFQLMFSREANRFETPALAEASRSAYHLQREAVEAVIPQASGEVKERMVDFAWASVHGFITLVLEGQLGEKDSSRALKARGLAVLSALVETVVLAGNR
ncbi:TetR/AcrR family transcriptional regulator [Reyranella sp.]|uniref:TetR/AcrR family transcriptional regulator n=1 Tax=Reyranella sp. TaxID=1929291 RepID=UPI003BA981FE